MRIAVWHNLPSGGGKRQLYYHVKGLVERGHHVEIWCPPGADETHLPLASLAPEHRVACRPIPWVPKPETQRRKKIVAYYDFTRDKIAAMDEHCRACAQEIEKGSFDLLFSNSCMHMRVASIARQVHLPSFMYLGEPNRALYEALPRLPWVAPPPMKSRLSIDAWQAWFTDAVDTQANRILAREEFLNAQAVKKLVVNSSFTRESVLRAYGLPASVCYLGVDTALFRPTGVARERFVLGLGAIHADKAIERSIQTIAAIPIEKRPPLVWIGNFANPSYLSEMHALATQLDVKFETHVAVTDETLIDSMNRAALLLYTPRLEPFGLAPLEANACETPVVGIAEGGIRETIENERNGLLVTEDSPLALSRAVLRLLENETYARAMGKRARESVLEEWSIKAANDRLEHYLQHLCNSFG